ncbi:MAG: adenine deaminase, partial [Thermodesulfobacteriota bacterium]|nr:adenine deaminase [Thermodesulfobacteriota bacterium]
MKTNCFDSKSFFYRDSQGLMDTALGKQYPDLVVINANLFNVYTGELCSNRCIIVCGNRIAYVGEGDDFNKGPETFVIDAENKTVI